MRWLLILLVKALCKISGQIALTKEEKQSVSKDETRLKELISQTKGQEELDSALKKFKIAQTRCREKL